MNTVSDALVAQLINGLSVQDKAAHGHPRVAEADRPRVLASLERLLVDRQALDQHIRLLQKRFGRTFPQLALLPETLVEGILSAGAGVLANDELAALLLNPIALRDLSWQIHEAMPDYWLERLSEVGQQVMQGEGIERKPRKADHGWTP
jgi:hypothetical protein